MLEENLPNQRERERIAHLYDAQWRHCKNITQAPRCEQQPQQQPRFSPSGNKQQFYWNMNMKMCIGLANLFVQYT